MPNKSERRKLRSFRKSAKGTKMINVTKKHSKLRCALCDKQLHGVTHGKTSSETKCTSKSAKRPTGAFAGILCGSCRSMVTLEAVKVKAGVKSLSDLDLTVKQYVQQLDKKVSA